MNAIGLIRPLRLIKSVGLIESVGLIKLGLMAGRGHVETG